MADDVLPHDGTRVRRCGFLRRNLFAIWGTLMLVGGIGTFLIDQTAAA